jgi:hypothetical protein
LKNASDIYFNFTGQISCTDFSDTDAAGNLDAAGWNVLACNQLAMPIDFGTKDSMFIEELFDEDQYSKDCEAKYGIKPNYMWADQQFGVVNYQKDYQAYSNIVFSNGELDPWRAGGVQDVINLQLPQYVIKGGAHHLDLRLPNPADNSTNVEWVRNQERLMIEQWVNDYQGTEFTPATERELKFMF